ncbi:MAG: N-6 DNA methylase, partial [Bacteroidales bacterium]|nr:N-6 DNA methylase [Bacteroidales bacterium]
MSLFQNSVITKYVNLQNKETILNKWSVYKTHFLNPVIQENIRNSKEEQYQGEFLIDLFVNVFGYTKNPTPNFNLITEIKNEKDSKKADGGIIVNDKVIGVIELKGTNTTDLQKIEVQAFGYKNNQKDCVYVITSNFEKLRFYIDNAIEHEEFNLFTLSLKEFEILYLCLAYENISQGIPKKLKDESLSHEDLITKQLYKDYSLFKRELFQNLTQLNPQFEALELFKKSQKLLDRFLFLFFAEDRQLLPPNSVRLILKQWVQLKELDEYKPLYERFKKYFGYLNTGFKGKQHDIFAYNGGLFKPDEILDTILIDDEILYKNTLKLSEYDFSSEVDVNILGHIFENSLNELDEIKAQLEGNEVNKSATKRKKDGVFYTPKYITKYIVENTVGKLCSEKKTEFQIIEEEYFTDKKRQIQTKKNLLDKITKYRDWLLKITIVDPACGSGAFLNEALNFLIAEHKYIDELEAKLLGGGIVFPNVENSILENNLFGVDINEESVEIAKLSLWLRTAQPNRKLNDLNNNIKCGNSLIDDPEVAGEKAFSWQKEFPTVFKEKQKKVWHVTWVTHDTRTSERMKKYRVRQPKANGELHIDRSVYLEGDEAIKVTEIIQSIVTEEQYNCLAYNICNDHVHMLLVCDEEELSDIVRKLKGKSAQLFKEYLGIPKDETFNLWAQKFDRRVVESHEYLKNAEKYIFNNREKHSLLDIGKGLQPLVQKMICTYEHAFRTEYNGGFDVVIGNPPYVQLQSLNETSKILEKSGFYTYEKTSDLYCLFYEKGNILLKNNGLLGFITSNKWLRANYGKALRNYLLQYTNPILLIDLGAGIFESATVDSNILIFKKEKLKTSLPFIANDLIKETKFSDFTFYENKKTEIKPIVDDIWIISNHQESQIKNKIEKNGTALKDWNIKINYGIKTGFNEAFIINEKTKNKLL